MPAAACAARIEAARPGTFLAESPGRSHLTSEVIMHDEASGGNYEPPRVFQPAGTGAGRRRDFDYERLFRKPRAWRDVKRAMCGGAYGPLFAGLEDAARPIGYSPRELLAVALHAYLSADERARSRMESAYSAWIDSAPPGEPRPAPRPASPPPAVALHVGRDVWAFVPRRGRIFHDGKECFCAISHEDKTLTVTEHTHPFTLGLIVGKAIHHSTAAGATSPLRVTHASGGGWVLCPYCRRCLRGVAAWNEHVTEAHGIDPFTGEPAGAAQPPEGGRP